MGEWGNEDNFYLTLSFHKKNPGLDKAETINQGASTNSVFCIGAETSGKYSSY
jgi:hypothetical protein